MTITNREVFVLDPTEGDIPNLGVAKVKNPEGANEWATLEWELRSFVCEGEYERGLDRILDQFLSHLSQNQQPAVWVSGFFGSGKSHLMRVLEYLWRDYQLPSGASARELANLTPDIERHLSELSAAAKRSGGIWSAAGTLGSGTPGSVRLAFLSVIFDAADLPQQYELARLVIWLKNEGIYDRVVEAITAVGKDILRELRNLYVSTVLAQALLDAGAKFGDTQSAVSTTLQSQFPPVSDISNDEMLDTFEQVLRLQSATPGKLPLTLVVLDEMQQFINDDNAAALNVQDLVEGCSSRFGSQVLIVATGQAALTADRTLQKLIDRFSVTVALSDTDVEAVVRNVVLRKRPDKAEEIRASLAKVSGEIDRQLGGTRLEARAADESTLIADYPLLPTRRRFWERALRSIDTVGKAGVLRTQLKIVHEAARSVADEPLGHVIGGDFVFRSEAASMLQSGVLLKEIDELIRGLEDGSEDGELKSRVCALIFLISQLPHNGVGDTGVRATAKVIADLLVEDLERDGAVLRKDVPRVLDELVEQGRVMTLGEEFRLQTEEGAEWTKAFSQRRVAIRDDAARMSQLRDDWLLAAVDDELRGIKLVHGRSKTPRKFSRLWGDDEPTVIGAEIPVWIRDGWNVTDAKAKEAAARAGNESPVVFVLLPKVGADAIRDALASHAAAYDTIVQRPEPQTDEGRQAKRSMQSRLEESERRLASLFGSVIAKARVLQGGGSELTTSSLREGVETAGARALARHFPKFSPAADNLDWAKVVKKANDGAPDALLAVGWESEVTANPVCKEVLSRVSATGTKGSELLRQLGDPPYGWPKDAVDGALLALLACGNVRAERDGQRITGPKELPPTKIGKATFFKEDEPPSFRERLEVRGLLTEAKVPFAADEEASAISGLLQRLTDLAARCGGPAPLPEPPDTAHLDALRSLAGNQQFRAVAEQAEPLRLDLATWTAASEQRSQREAAWSKLNRLLAHAGSLDEAAEVRTQADAVRASRLLLSSPDPVASLIDQLSSAIRTALFGSVAAFGSAAAAERAALESSEGWDQLSDAQTQQVLAVAGLEVPDAPEVSSLDALLAALDARPLQSYQDQVEALPVKAAAARRKIAAIVDPAPALVSVKPPGATIKSEADVDAYLSALRDELIGHVSAGETVII